MKKWEVTEKLLEILDDYFDEDFGTIIASQDEGDFDKIILEVVPRSEDDVFAFEFKLKRIAH